MAAKKTWIILASIFALSFLLIIIVFIGILASFDTTPVVKKDTVLKLQLSGLITEHFAENLINRELEGANLQMLDIYQALEMATMDDRIKGLYLRVGISNLGWAKAQEIRSAINKFKQSGKFVTAFMEFCDEKSYYVALSADEIFLQPYSFAEFNGFASEIPFLKRTLDKLGIEAQVENAGKYKSAGDIFKRDSMSEAHREETQALLDDIYQEFVQTVSEARDIDRPSFEATLNKGIYQSEDALTNKLVDDLKYEPEVLDSIKVKIYGEGAAEDETKRLRMISVSKYAKISPEDVGFGRGEKIGLIYAIGQIVSGPNGYDPLMGRNMGSQSITRLLEAANRNKKIKAIVLRVDSPGGSGVASDEMWAVIQKVRKNKPVIVSMSDVAASGGYWISMGCDAIVAQPTTITGSIGVLGMVFDLSSAYNKLGIVWETVKTGAHADMMTDKRPMTDDERKTFKKIINDFYKTFVEKVAEGRDKTWDEVHEIAQGRVWTGLRAQQLGLVDTLGGYDAALTLAKRKANLADDVQTQWVIFPKPKGLLGSVLDRIGVRVADLFRPSSVYEWTLINSLPAEARAALKEIALLHRVRAGEILALTPYVPEIR
jgi:protease-4